MADAPLLNALIDLSQVSEGVVRAHAAPLTARGLFDIESRPVARIWGLPRSGRQVETSVEVLTAGECQIWRRSFAGQPVETRQWVADGRLVESKGPGRIAMRLSVEDGGVRYRTERAWLGPLPTPWFPRVDAVVREAEGGWSVAVEVRWWPFGVICRYSGMLRSV